jgi:TP901 family phage tail tape measure protein
MANDATLNAAIDARKMTSGAEEGARAARKLTDSVNKIGGASVSTEKRIGKMIARFATIGLAIKVFRDAIRTIAAFEYEMSTLQVVTNATTQEFERMHAVARQLGATTRFSATEAAEGLTFLARAGFNASSAIQALPHTLNLAAVSGMALGASADLASNVLGQFSLAARETERVVDAMMRTTNQSNTNVQQLGEALKMAGPIAGALGRSVEETSVAIGLLGDRGIQASMAGVGLRTILLSLIAPTSEAKKVIEDMGLSMEKLDPITNDLATVFERLRKAELTVQQATVLFNTRAAGAGVILAQTAPLLEKRIRDQEAMASGASGAARMNNTLEGSIKGLQSAWEELFLGAGDSGLKWGFKTVTDQGTDFLRLLGTGGEPGSISGSMSALRDLWKELNAEQETATALVAKYSFLLSAATLNPSFLRMPQPATSVPGQPIEFGKHDVAPKSETLTRADILELEKKSTANSYEQQRLRRMQEISNTSGPPFRSPFGSDVPRPGGLSPVPSDPGGLPSAADTTKIQIAQERELRKAAVETNRAYQERSQALAMTADAFADIVIEGRKLQEVLRDLVKQFARMAIQRAFQQMAGSAASSDGFGNSSFQTSRSGSVDGSMGSQDWT